MAHSVTCHGAHHPHTCSSHGHMCNGETREQPGHVCMDGMDASNRMCLTRNVKNASQRRFFPHLEQIPEESRNNTFKSSVQTKKSDSDTSSDGSITTSDIEYKEDINYNPGTGSQESSTNKSNPRSMDSGIATRYC